MKTLRIFALCLASLSAIACTTFETKTPSGFVELEENPSHAYRATTPDGLVIAVREIENDPDKGGDLNFWFNAVKNTLRQRGGYALLSERDIKTSQGLTGKELTFGHDEGSKPHEYKVVLFLAEVTTAPLITKDRIFVLEAGGTKELMRAHAKDIDDYVASFRVD